MKDGEVVKINADINPITETESCYADAKFYLGSGKANMKEHVEATPINLKDSKVQWVAIKWIRREWKRCSLSFHHLKETY